VIEEHLIEEYVDPGQYYDKIHRSSEQSPEHRLLGAIFEDAIRCWLQLASVFRTNYSTNISAMRQKLWAEADRWIFGDFIPERGFTFEDICNYLDIDADDLRSKLKNWSSGPAQPRLTQRRMSVQSKDDARIRITERRDYGYVSRRVTRNRLLSPQEDEKVRA